MNIVYLINVSVENMIPIYHLKDGDKFAGGWAHRIGTESYDTDYSEYMNIFKNITKEWIDKEITFLVKKK